MDSRRRFPRASRYDRAWVAASASSSANALWMTEWLTEAMRLRAGMNVLDLGCGRAVSSIFLGREFGVRVWAVDLWFSPADNARRIEEAGLADAVHPIRADARALPFSLDFFDAALCIDAYSYFGTDDLYLNYLARFLKPGGELGIVGAGLTRELEEVPPHLRPWWTQSAWSLHSAQWWRRHWARTGIVTVDVADTMPEGWRLWIEWLGVIAPENHVELDALHADAGTHLGYIRVAGRRNADAKLEEPITSMT